ncbi:MAG: glycosyltransferase [Proteobacteria bacterium]|nr:glycosyltransferase [Pseudomonadota bacterium]
MMQRNVKFGAVANRGGRLNGKTLIVFTTCFPFGTGEEFFEEELFLLAENFERLFIVSANGTEKQTKKVPANSVVLRRPLKTERWNALRPGIVFSKDCASEILSSCVTERTFLTPSKMWTLFYFLNAGIDAEKQISEIVEEYGVEDLNKLFLYSYWNNYFAYGISRFKQKQQNTTAITRAHSIDLYVERSSKKYLPLRRLTAERLDAIFFVSEHGQNYFEHRLPGAGLLKTSRLGTRKPPRGNEASTDGLFRVLSCSYMKEVKRIDLLVEALSMIEAPHIKWTHIGAGQTKKQIETLSRQLLLPKKNISFEFLGHLTNEKIYEYYEKLPVDIFINVSDFEGIPVAMMEAISFGVPVIGRDVGGMSELVEDNAGLLLPHTVTPQKIAGALERMIYLPIHERERMRNSAFSLWQKRFSARNNYRLFLQEIMSLADEGR